LRQPIDEQEYDRPGSTVAAGPRRWGHLPLAGESPTWTEKVFDVLTWRKVPAENVDPDLFTDLTFVDEARQHQWLVADTTVNRPVDDEQVFTMRQVSLVVAGNKTGRAEHGQDSTRRIHVLTTRTDLASSRLTNLGG
jgi:hypothetical protein